jgi:hypothetical protein
MTKFRNSQSSNSVGKGQRERHPKIVSDVSSLTTPRDLGKIIELVVQEGASTNEEFTNDILKTIKYWLMDWEYKFGFQGDSIKREAITELIKELENKQYGS